MDKGEDVMEYLDWILFVVAITGVILCLATKPKD